MRRSVMRHHPAVWAIAASASATVVCSAQTSPYEILVAGLSDATHTRSDGGRNADARWVNADGSLAGIATRYVGATARGWSSMVFTPDDGLSLAAGFFDAAHTDVNGSSTSTPLALFADATAAGYSRRQDLSTSPNATVWRFAGGATVPAGPQDASHLDPQGRVRSDDLGTFAAKTGLIVGTSLRFMPTDGTAGAFWSAWADDPAVGVRVIGLRDAEHVTSNGSWLSIVRALSPNGHVLGYSTRFLGGSVARGATVWIHHAPTGTTLRAGLSGSEFQSSAGTINHSARLINPAGQAAGTTTRYVGLTSAGPAAWRADFATEVTVRIGLFAPPFISAAGVTDTAVAAISDAGHVVGDSARYSASTAVGRTAWVHDPGADAARVVGLDDATHVNNAGFAVNNGRLVNARGDAAGTATVFNGTATARGRSAWYARGDGSPAVRVGIYDELHNGPSGPLSDPVFLNARGELIGKSTRFSPIGAGTADTWWHYDPVSGVQTTLVFSVPPTGCLPTATSSVIGFTDDGLVYGSYLRYTGCPASGSNTPRPYALLWTAVAGRIDPESLVPGGIGAAGWSSLTSVMAVSASAGGARPTLAGTGVRTTPTSNTRAFVLRPTTACPCVADFDGSGGTPDLTDVSAYFAVWLAGESAADADCSGGVPDLTDISAFFAQWLAGGC